MRAAAVHTAAVRAAATRPRHHVAERAVSQAGPRFAPAGAGGRGVQLLQLVDQDRGRGAQRGVGGPAGLGEQPG